MFDSVISKKVRKPGISLKKDLSVQICRDKIGLSVLERRYEFNNILLALS